MGASQDRSLAVVSHPWTAWCDLHAEWSALAEASPYTNFFLTAPWVSSWLAIFGADLEPCLLVFRRAASSGETVAMCLLISRTERRGPFQVRRVYLNTSGEDEADETFIEHNAFVCLAGWEKEVAVALRTHLDENPWDEFVTNGMADGPCLGALLTAGFSDVEATQKTVLSHYVDLRSIDSDDGYLPTLSRNTREQIRRSCRLYSKGAPLELDAPRTALDARTMLDELAELHQAAWTARGKHGVFSSNRFRAFHYGLIANSFSTGGLQLLRIRTGQTAIGMLYNFVHRGKVFFYQSGLRFSDDNRLKPGLVAHSLAIQHYRSLGFSEYDFLGGEGQYKRSLATKARTLTWLAFHKRTLKRQALTILQEVKRTIQDGRPRSAALDPDAVVGKDDDTQHDDREGGA